MKIFHSLRWRLQFWHGLLLLLALAGLGASAWQLQRANQFGRIDRELEQRMAIVEGAVPSRPFEGRRVGASGELDLSARDRSIFEGVEGHQFYYVVWHRDGEIRSASAWAPPDVPRPERKAGAPTFRSRGEFRECFHYTPDGKCTLVGRDISAEMSSGRRAAWMLAGAGSALLALGLAGGWLIASRSLRPIAEISSTAGKIANGDLAERIHIQDPKSELGRLSLDLNRTFERLQDAFARQTRFTADASHELRTPLSVMLMEAQSALSRERSVAESRQSLEVCQRAAQRMRSLIESLLLLARFDANGPCDEVQSCDLSQVARDASDLIAPLAREKGVALHLDLEPVVCGGNPEQLAQAVGNIVSNAVHYNRPGGNVGIAVQREQDCAVLTVTDTGRGVSSLDLPHIFDRFYRVDKARSCSDGHAGLGLSIAKALVESWGGTVSAASEFGVGSTFVVRLPACLR